MQTGYSRAQILIHWAIAILIVVNYFIADGMGEVFDKKLGGAAVTTPWHVWLGLAVLALVVLRLILRFGHGAPAASGAAGSLTQKLASAAHILLYLLMIGVPVGGAVVWYLGVEALGDIHVLAGNGLLILAGLHALAGLYHHYFVKDGVLLRMMRPR